ncbi:hypothetical protein V5799_033711 [Amblyomma americanum]|uniref:Uncharacterized protein n=1 Tax=Amblyomma americanum TaxID=6943 RepID=A0AAQ4DMI7_AMBAM
MTCLKKKKQRKKPYTWGEEEEEEAMLSVHEGGDFQVGGVIVDSSEVLSAMQANDTASSGDSDGTTSLDDADRHGSISPLEERQAERGNAGLHDDEWHYAHARRRAATAGFCLLCCLVFLSSAAVTCLVVLLLRNDQQISALFSRLIDAALELRLGNFD